jgi:hypothetical protein
VRLIENPGAVAQMGSSFNRPRMSEPTPWYLLLPAMRSAETKLGPTPFRAGWAACGGPPRSVELDRRAAVSPPHRRIASKSSGSRHNPSTRVYPDRIAGNSSAGKITLSGEQGAGCTRRRLAGYAGFRDSRRRPNSFTGQAADVCIHHWRDSQLRNLCVLETIIVVLVAASAVVVLGSWLKNRA